MSALTCSKCSASLDENDFNLEMGVARCSYCKAWTRIGSPLSQSGSDIKKLRKNVPIPDKYVIEESGDELRISWKWFSATVFFMIPFCLFWNGFLVVWYSIALSEKDTNWMMVLFPMIHVMVGVLLTYSTLAMLFNKTTVLVKDYSLFITHGPIPWKGAEIRNTDDLKQVYCKLKISKGKNSTTYTYDVNALLFNGKEKNLISRLETKEEAIYLEQMIEQYLGIEDEAVAGEISS